MNLENPLMFGIDADVPARVMLKSMFQDRYVVELFASVEECEKRLEADENLPAVILCNVGEPGSDGFEFCRRIKAEARTAEIPVLFLSRDESLTTRLRGYDCGGEDFILKPYAVEEVRRKVEVALAALGRTESLRQQMSDTEELSSLLLANMDEYAVLIHFMRRLNECENEDGIAEAVLAALSGFALEGAVQIRLPDLEFTLSAQGRDRPLEVSVLDHVRTMERIFQFRQRCVCNFERLTVLVNNLPVEDADACGRLRDHLAIAAEMADARLAALQALRRDLATRGELAALVAEIGKTVDANLRRYNALRYQGALVTDDLLLRLAATFAHLGLSEAQEQTIEQMVRAEVLSLIDLFDTGDETATTLSDLGARLERLRR